ncbi:Ty1/Copia family ribonuclease HI, partial [Klebsiella pneumoniae]|uniref:Ty1/Copia family ribonuclease HI n=1 Tax=Klebsiella pneumoniae TaxID=573 RepID=UPI003A7FACD7
MAQMKFAEQIIQRSGLTDDKHVDTPEALGMKLRLKDGEPLTDPTPYRQLVGALSYLTITRPDISHAVHMVSQFQHAPTTVHMGAAMRIVRYLRHTINKGVFLSASSSLELIAYTDVDWGGDPDERRSVLGYCVYIGHNVVTWSSKKQKAIAKSSTEAEYRAMAAGTA